VRQETFHTSNQEYEKLPKRKKTPKLAFKLPGTLSEAFINELQTLLEGETSFKAEYLKSELLSKYLDTKATPAKVRHDNAVNKWLTVERQNQKTNVRLYCHEEDFGWIDSLSLVGRVRSLISSLLGPLKYMDVISDGTHTNGASTRIKRKEIASFEKLTGDAHVSSSAVRHYLAFRHGTVLEGQNLEYRASSGLFTVPKKSDIDRVACKEPEVNMLLQKSVGNHIRRRLLWKVGIDLDDQTINQELARVAVSKKLATIDLSSASDTISNQLVISLLPSDWWSLLDDLRVKSTIIKGKEHHLQMFSSMGNGFTFELESLLFYAITRVVMEGSGIQGRLSVYGDDIIAPAKVVRRLQRVFSFFGFTMNPKKTHSTGLFRESCGKHYYDNLDVSPFYIRERISTLLDLISLLNKFLEWDGRGWGFLQTPEAVAFHKKWSSYIPNRLHGGLDPEDPTALVTGGSARHRLVPVTRAIHTPWLEEARLKSWYLTRGDGDGYDDAVTIDPRCEISFKTEAIKAYGVRTTWKPYILMEGTTL
jgi:hypothetical protein